MENRTQKIAVNSVIMREQGYGLNGAFTGNIFLSDVYERSSFYEEYPLYHSNNLHRRVVAWSVCVERNRVNSRSHYFGYYFIIARYNSQSIGFSI